MPQRGAKLCFLKWHNDKDGMDLGWPVVVIRLVVKKKINIYLAGVEVTNWYNFILLFILLLCIVYFYIIIIIIIIISSSSSSSSNSSISTGSGNIIIS